MISILNKIFYFIISVFISGYFVYKLDGLRKNNYILVAVFAVIIYLMIDLSLNNLSIEKFAEFNDGEVGEWTDWSRCDKYCGPGVSKRTRKLIRPARGKENPELVETRECNLGDCENFEMVSEGDCSKRCGGGVKKNVYKAFRMEIPDLYLRLVVKDEDWKAALKRDDRTAMGEVEIPPPPKPDNLSGLGLYGNVFAPWNYWPDVNPRGFMGTVFVNGDLKTKTNAYIEFVNKVKRFGTVAPLDSPMEVMKFRFKNVWYFVEYWLTFLNLNKGQSDVYGFDENSSSTDNLKKIALMKFFKTKIGDKINYNVEIWHDGRRVDGMQWDTDGKSEAEVDARENSKKDFQLITVETPCNEDPCGKDCVLEWTDWSECSKDCGGGVTQRFQNIVNEAQPGGKKCQDKYYVKDYRKEEKPCNTAECKVSAASSEKPCSKSCGGGVKEKTVEICTDKIPNFYPRYLFTDNDWKKAIKERSSLNKVEGSNPYGWETRVESFKRDDEKGVGDYIGRVVDDIYILDGKFKELIKLDGRPGLEDNYRVQNFLNTPLAIGKQFAYFVEYWLTILNLKSGKTTVYANKTSGPGGIGGSAVYPVGNLEFSTDGNGNYTMKFVERKASGGKNNVEVKWNSNQAAVYNQQIGNGGEREAKIEREKNGKNESCVKITSMSTCNLQACEKGVQPVAPVFSKDVDCSYSEWRESEPCNKPCGPGLKVMKRDYTFPQGNGKKDCEPPDKYESLMKIVECNLGPCPGTQSKTTSTAVSPAAVSKAAPAKAVDNRPVDCSYTPWRDKEMRCSKECGGGEWVKIRDVIPGRNGGKNDCNESLINILPCNTFPCQDKDCSYTDWVDMECSKSCGGGMKNQLRMLIPGMGRGKKDCNEPLSRSVPCNTQSCGTDCFYSPWVDSGQCSKGCGGGVITQKRIVIPGSGNGKNDCNEALIREVPCNTDPCNEDCQYSSTIQEMMEKPWSSCSKECGGGIRKKTRTIVKQASGKGKKCDEILEFTEPCNTQPCKVDCQYSNEFDKIPWSDCSKICGGGTRTKKRTIVREGANGGKLCNEPLEMKEDCNTQLCVGGDCQLSDWGEWSKCPPCGPGTQTRTRTVKKEADKGRKPCSEFNLTESRPCTNKPCPIKCQMSDWTVWSDCDKPCGEGKQRRTRKIEVIPTDGEKCPESEEVRKCITKPCETDCKVSDWGKWTECSEPCGKGKQTRTRKILVESKNGKACPPLTESKDCQVKPCSKDCEVYPWGDWTGCSKGCKGGIRKRTRLVKQKASDGGKACPILEETENCSEKPCPVNCKVSQWGEWSGCSKACNGGIRTRSRKVLQVNRFDGEECPVLTQTETCNLDPCPVNCEVSDWTAWGKCSKECGGGKQKRTRDIVTQPLFGGLKCPRLVDERKCNDRPCIQNCEVSEWTPYSECSKRCGGGNQTRTRYVVRKPSPNGEECPGLSETINCNAMPCPIDCKVSEWSDFGECSKKCGGGEKVRTRTVTAFPEFEGKECPPLKDVVGCNEKPCPKNCKVSRWGVYSECSKECGSGVKVRTRQILEPHEIGGEDCPPLVEAESCNNQTCDEDCEVSKWSDWSRCTRKCGGGVQIKTRKVVKKEKNNGIGCPPLIQMQRCNTKKCVGDEEDDETSRFKTIVADTVEDVTRISDKDLEKLQQVVNDADLYPARILNKEQLVLLLNGQKQSNLQPNFIGKGLLENFIGRTNCEVNDYKNILGRSQGKF